MVALDVAAVGGFEAPGNASVVRMTSREIADLVEKRHDNVKRTIETLAERGTISRPQIEGGTKAANGVIERQYLVGKRDSYVIVAQLSPEFTARLVDRWQELEARGGFAIPQTLPDALRLAADMADELVSKSAQLALAAPKAAALDRLQTVSDGSFCLTDAAKALQVPPRKFLARLQQMGWIYRRPMGSGWLAYQDRITVGVMEHKVTTGEKSDGSDWVSTQVRVTAKGMARLALLIDKAPVAA